MSIASNRKYLTAKHEKIIQEIETKKELEHTTEYNVPLQKDRNYIEFIIMED